MNRTELDAFVADHRLPADAVAAALALTHNQPAPAEWRAFGARLLEGLGVLGLAAGAIFFVAANWEACGVFGRFAILECALLACVGVALWRAPPQRTGQAALLLATLLTGALLALFGQTYQTGADVHELFFGWALLGLPFVLAAQWGAAWATWLCVLNVGLALHYGMAVGRGGLAWSAWWWWGGPSLRVPAATLMLSLANFALAGLTLAAARTRQRAALPRWLLRFEGTLAFGFGTWASVLAIFDDGALRHDAPMGQRLLVVAVFAGLSIATLAGALRRHSDIFPLALLGASWIAVSTAFIAKVLPDNAGLFFVLTLWLLGLAAAMGALLMRLLRAWQAEVPAGRSAR